MSEEIPELFTLKDGVIYREGKEVSLEKMVDWTNRVEARNDVSDKLIELQKNLIGNYKKLSKNDDYFIDKLKSGINEFHKTTEELSGMVEAIASKKVK